MSIAKDARFWDRAARKYAQSTVSDQAGYERTLQRTRDHLGPNDRVLELGCGTGTTALRLAQGVQDYLATDISAQMIAIAREKLSDSPIPGLHFDTATVDTIPDADRFNAIIGFNYLHLVRDLPATLRQIHRLLADGGLLITKTPCVGDMNPLIRLAIPVMRAIGKAPFAGVFRATDLQRHLQVAGFAIVAVENHATKSTEARPYIVARKT